MSTQLRTLLHNFIWSRKEGRARAKVKWTTITLPTSKGEFKVIDPTAQANVLLTHLLIIGLTIGNEPWKHLIEWEALHIQPKGKF
jgi:hypothetical protein